MTARNERAGRPSAEGEGRRVIADSVGLSVLMVAMFVLLTIAMYEQLPGRTYLVWGGAGYAMGFVLGFLMGRQEPKTDVGRWR